MVLQFILGFIASFVATLPPGLLNLTSLKISLEKGIKKSHYFALGVSTIIFFQSYISLAILKYMHNQTMVGVYMQIIGVIVFTTLIIYFFRSYLKVKRDIPKKPSRIKNSFYLPKGMLWSLSSGHRGAHKSTHPSRSVGSPAGTQIISLSANGK